MTWHHRPMSGFDVESSGVNPETDRIVTACVVRVGAGLDTSTTTWLADPGVDIPAEATAVHGISTEHARAKGRPAGEVINEIVEALAAAAAEGTPIVAMNAPFDLTMLEHEAARNGVKCLFDRTDAIPLVIDPRVLDKHVDPYRRGRRTLTDLCAHYRVRLDGAHTADADALAACRVVWRIAQRYPQIAQTDLEYLHEQQVTWAAEQAESLRAHYAGTAGREHLADGVRGEWPFVPAPTERNGVLRHA